MNIAFCINRLGLAGLGATIASLLRSCSDSKKLKIFFLCAYLKTEDKTEIRRLLSVEKFLGEEFFVDFDPIIAFSAFRSLHGDWTTYGRLLLPDIIDCSQVLYLDADLVIEVDVLDLLDFDFGNKALAAVSSGTLKTEYENAFFINKLGLAANLQSFNAGVLLLNLNEWREKKLKDKCFDIGKRNPMDLLSADQTMLNALFAGNFAALPSSFNCLWPANYPRPCASHKMIIHFVGSPKPWDILGSRLHEGFTVWKKYSDKKWEKKYGVFTRENLKRTWNLRRSYVRIIRNKIKKQY